MAWRRRFQLPIKQIFSTAILVLAIMHASGYAIPDPPIPPNPVDPYAILHKQYEAIGGIDRLKAITTVYTEGSTEYDGLKGNFKLWEKNPLQYRLEEDFTVISQVQGDDGQISWKKDTNGKVVLLRDEETLKRRKIALGFENFEHLDPTSSLFTVTYEGIQQSNEHPCHVIKISNRLNQDVLWNFIDQVSFLLLKSVHRQPDIEIHTIYKDYRTVNGILVPFHDESQIFPRQKKEVNRIEKRIMNTPIDPSLFSVPADASPDYVFQTGDRSENIPFQLIEDLIYLEVTTKKDTRMWLLDSGASMSVIDQLFALEMGILPQGAIKGYGFGANFDLQFVKLPAFSIQGIRFGEQTIFSFQGLTPKFHEPSYYGILGFDFLSRFIIKIDYAAKQLSLYDPKHFVYTGDGVIIDAPLKNGVFTLPMTVDGMYSGKWSLDVGSFNTSFHFPFAKTNNLFTRKGVFRISRGIGGEYLEKTIQFDLLSIGNLTIEKPLISIPDEKGSGATSSAELIGTIGNSILRHFTVYLNYATQQVIFERGSDFQAIFPHDNSGMQVGKNVQGNPCIVFISPESPGEKAGFLEGDVIAKINQRNFNHNSDLILIKNLLRQPEGTKLQFEIIRNNRKKKIRLRLENIYKY